MLNEMLLTAIAADRAADLRHDAANARRARQVPAGISRRVPRPRRPHSRPSGQARTATRAI
jgi:hypothetical protein